MRPNRVISQLLRKSLHFFDVFLSKDGFTVTLTLENDIDEIICHTSGCFDVLQEVPFAGVLLTNLLNFNYVALERSVIFLSMHIGELHFGVKVFKIAPVLPHDFSNLDIDKPFLGTVSRKVEVIIWIDILERE